MNLGAIAFRISGQNGIVTTFYNGPDAVRIIGQNNSGKSNVLRFISDRLPVVERWYSENRGPENPASPHEQYVYSGRSIDTQTLKIDIPRSALVPPATTPAGNDGVAINAIDEILQRTGISLGGLEPAFRIPLSGPWNGKLDLANEARHALNAASRETP